MGKRSEFKRNTGDFYETFDDAAVKPLANHLPIYFTYVSPCYGEGELEYNIKRNINGANILGRYDLNSAYLDKIEDACISTNYPDSDFFMENPPWARHILHAIIENLSNQRPTWLLFDADWHHTVQKLVAKKYGVKTVPELLKRCVKIVSVGRIRWIKGTKMKGKDNCCWYLFDKNHDGPTEFIGRTQ